jgi:hypothetical protein
MEITLIRNVIKQAFDELDIPYADKGLNLCGMNIGGVNISCTSKYFSKTHRDSINFSTTGYYAPLKRRINLKKRNISHNELVEIFIKKYVECTQHIAQQDEAREIAQARRIEREKLLEEAKDILMPLADELELGHDFKVYNAQKSSIQLSNDEMLKVLKFLKEERK